jgi:hypothetical protein
MDNTQKPRFMIKVNANAIRRNVDNMSLGRPLIEAWVVVNGQNPEQCRFVHAVKMREATGVTSKPLPDGYGHSIAYLLTTDSVDVQLERDGEFRNLESLLEEGAVQWESWYDEYSRLRIDGCS